MIRVGSGYDVHRLVMGRLLVLGGVTIPYEYGLEGHSDADVLVHAMADALLGAAAMGDIGAHFPDTDERWRGVDSLLLLEHVARMVKEKGYRINNIDSTLVLQRPKIRPYVDAMCANISRVLDIDPEAVSIKATTNEGLGFVGAGQGAVAYAVVCIEK